MSITYKNKKTTINIGDSPQQIVVQCHPGRTGIKLQIRIAKLVMPMMKSGGDGKVNMDINELAKTLITIEDDRIEALLLGILKHTMINNKIIDGNMFDLQFSGEYGFLVDVVKFVLEANFGSFLEKLGILKPPKEEE